MEKEKRIALAYNETTIKAVSIMFQYLDSLKSPFAYPQLRRLHSSEAIKDQSLMAIF